MPAHDDLREAVRIARERGSTKKVLTIAKVWPARTMFGQRVRIRGSLCATYLGPSGGFGPDDGHSLIDLDIAEAERWLARQDART